MVIFKFDFFGGTKKINKWKITLVYLFLDIGTSMILTMGYESVIHYFMYDSEVLWKKFSSGSEMSLTNLDDPVSI